MDSETTPTGTPVDRLVMPNHHERYARAWSLHRDPSMSDELRRILECEMDEAQNHFGWDEFQQFKETLPGYVEYWEGAKESILADLRERFSA